MALGLVLLIEKSIISRVSFQLSLNLIDLEVTFNLTFQLISSKVTLTFGKIGSAQLTSFLGLSHLEYDLNCGVYKVSYAST